MVDINVKLSFSQQESDLLEMAANLGAPNLTDDIIKGIILNAASNHVVRFSKGVFENHRAKLYPVTPMDEERHLTRHLERLDNQMAKTKADLARLRSMRLKPVKS